MSCEIETKTGPKQVYDHQTCIACRHDTPVKCGITPLLTPGVLYEKCTLLVKPEEGCEPLTALADIDAEKDRIVAVVGCEIDLTETTEEDNCPMGVLTNVGLDANYICWPEGATAEQIDMLERNLKGCIWFETRRHCTPVPDEFSHLLQTKEAVKAKVDVKTEAKVPVAPSSDAEAVA